MTGSMLIDGMMVFFTLVLFAAVAVPLWRVGPGRMAGVKARRIAFHTSAVAAIDAELARPQRDPAQADRLAAQRQRNIAALLSLDPAAMAPPPGAGDFPAAA